MVDILLERRKSTSSSIKVSRHLISLIKLKDRSSTLIPHDCGKCFAFLTVNDVDDRYGQFHQRDCHKNPNLPRLSTPPSSLLMIALNSVACKISVNGDALEMIGLTGFTFNSVNRKMAGIRFNL